MMKTKKIYINNLYISSAFDFGCDEYSILKVRINEDANLIPIDFDDFIKLYIDKINGYRKRYVVRSIQI